jgi:ankyrin repeat protein
MTDSESKEDTGSASDERNFMKEFMSAAVNGEGKAVQRKIIEYSTKHELAPYSVLKDFKDTSKRSAIHFACQSVPNKNEETDIVKLLLEKTKFPSSAIEAMVQLKDVDEVTPLMLACQSMHSKTYERIKCILDIDPKAALACSKTKATPLHFAAGAGASKEVIDLLCQHAKSTISACTAQGSTPLHWAIGDPPPKDYSETANALIDTGADVNFCSEGGIPALIVALASSNDAHGKLLVERGADRGVILSGGVTVYHMVADLNLKASLQAMLDADAGADLLDGEETTTSKCLKMKNASDETPLDLAAQRGHFGCFKLLSGEEDDQKAKAAMMKLQKVWNEKRKDKPKESSGNGNKPGTIVVDPEADAKKAAAMLISDPPPTSDEEKAKSAELKALGNSHFSKGEWEAAIEQYTAAIAVNPLDATYYSNRSACYLKVKKNQEALNDAVICRYLKPKWLKGCFRLSTARLAMGRYEDAAVSAWEGLQIEEGNPELETLVTKCIKKGRKEMLEKKDAK